MTLAIRPAEWTEAALCAQVDPALFFPEKGEDTRPAKRICAACPVRAACLEAHIDERLGVWGGMSGREREKERTRRRRIAREAAA